MPDGIQQYVKLENRLVLLAWLNSLFGYRSNRELLEDCKAVGEGFGADGRSHLYHHLVARGDRVQIPADDLERYDTNIRLHLESINRGRTEKITLRYFQHLAALYTEIYLDRLFNHKAQFLADLNAFVAGRNASRLPGEPQDESFTEDDLTKLAFWMATGSGKTLILHLNYHQFLHYNREPLDNILLITPNEGLSEQHLAELTASGIQDAVQVIEITKLVEEKRGGGVSVPVEAFEGRNLIFVDEGHKGSGGEAWRKYRDTLGATGFTFEYSATFGQALSAARNDPLTAEYGKAIIFDYSYRYFYGDGFGKDFRILNLRDEARPDQTDTLLMGNLLSFYEQVRIYDEQIDTLRPYNLEKPLWVFVGHTVKGKPKDAKETSSDVLTVARFLQRFLSERKWAIATIEAVLDGKTGLVAPDDSDVFAGRFPFLHEAGNAGVSSARLYDDILQRIFHAPAGGGLHLCDIKSSPGELGLKAANATDYFGLIYIDDTSKFKKLVEAGAPEIVLEQDAIAASLFERIDRPDSGLHVLIGAKKFMEGWNSLRVASMGLLHIGKNEGSQIIQLFGRGVRLKGKEMSLKRSAALEGSHPQHLRLLETLNIFAVRANYMALFRVYLEREGVEVEPAIELPLFVWINQPAIQKELVVPRVPEDKSFQEHVLLILERDEKEDKAIHVRLDLSVKVQAMESTAHGPHTAMVQAGVKSRIPEESLALVDWEQVYLDLLDYKARKGWRNLILRPQTPRQLMGKIDYTLIADEATVLLRTFAERQRLQEVVTNILCKYTDAFYRQRRERWETQVMEYRPLDERDPNLGFNRDMVREGRPAYVVQVRKSDEEFIKAIEKLIQEEERLYREENNKLPRIAFNRHVYLPLLVEKVDVFKSIPPALKESEAQFVRDLKAFWEEEKDNMLAGKEIYLLRNLSRGKGIGFFEESGFYPDFILWVLDHKTNTQRILFIEPHGMLHAKAYIHDEKVRLHERLPELAKQIAQHSNQKNITLDAFIISATPYDELYKRYDDGKWNRAKFAERHILFLERGQGYDYMRIIFEQLTRASS